MTWSLGTLGAGASGSMTCQAVVSSGILVCGVLTTTAAIQGSENDLNPADNMASAHTVVGSANPETGGGPLRITRIAKFDEEIYQVFFQTNPGRNYVLQYTEDFSNWTTDPG